MQPKKDSDGFLDQYIRALVISTSHSYKDVCEMTVLQLIKTVKTLFAKEEYDLEVKSRLAGAKSDSPLRHWLITADEK